MRAKIIGSIALMVVAATLCRFVSGPRDAPVADAPEGSQSNQNRPAVHARTSAPEALSIVQSNVLNEQTLVGTTWERDGFKIEFGSDGKLLIGGRERAKWRVEGSRVRLYRDTTGEEHWLDIVDNKLTWKDQEISRVE